MSSKPKVLFVLTSCNKLGNGHPTGWFLPEFAHPYNVLSEVADITIVSPKGGEAPLDQSSVEMFKDDKESTAFLSGEKEKLWKNTEKLEDYTDKVDEFAAIFYVGGHGPMIDLVDWEPSKKLAADFFDKGKVVSAVCHGPAALAKVKLSNGELLIKDQEVTAFSNTEEDQVKLSDAMPFMLETLIKEQGAKYEIAKEPWGEKVCVARGGRLITGQNPASAGPLGEAVKKQILAH